MQTIQTIIGPKTSRTRNFDGAFQNDGKISECDQGRASIKQDVSKNIIKKKNKRILYRLSNTFLFTFLVTFNLFYSNDRKKRSIFDINMKNLQKLFRLSGKLGYKGNAAYPVIR